MLFVYKYKVTLPAQKQISFLKNGAYDYHECLDKIKTDLKCAEPGSIA
jgi:hypothetical protein